jgi:CBS domain-containing protein
MDEPTETSLLHSTIFFDLTPFYGDGNLARQLQGFIQESYSRNKRFTAFLAQNALKNPPPLGFFKTFLLEKSGEHRDAFDIKARAMMPLADAARLRSLENQTMFPASTIERYQRLIFLDKTHESRYEDCAVAYEIFMRIRAKQGLRDGHDGRYIAPDKLSPLEKQMLKKAFEPIAAIQHLIKPM